MSKFLSFQTYITPEKCREAAAFLDDREKFRMTKILDDRVKDFYTHIVRSK